MGGRGVKTYLSGAMTGIENLNFPAFHEAADRLRAQGHEVISPAESFDGDITLARETYLRWDIEQVLAVEAVAVLPGWQHSKGARLEVAVAVAIGIPVLWATDMSPVPDALLHPICRCSS